MKLVQKNKRSASLLKLGFSTLFLNRTNHSGILNGGIIGGLNQKGKYKIDCRFNKNDLITKISKISENKNNIELYNLDAIDLINKIKKESKCNNSILYFDPPYFLKGPRLYMNSYKKDNHIKVANEIKKIDGVHWIVSYDNRTEIKNIYKWVPKNKIVEFNIQHSAYKTRLGEEILFFSNCKKESISL